VAGWQVVEIRAHEEFLRVYLERDGVATGAEIVWDDGGPGALSSAHYRVQPAPDAASPPDEDLLRALVPDLAAWEAAGGAESGPAPRGARAAADPGGPPTGSATPLGGALALLLLAALVLGALLVARSRRRREAGPLLGLGAALILLVGVRLAPAALVPVAWLTPLHEGGSEYLAEVLHGHYPNAGPVFAAVKALLVGTHDRLALPGVVLANTALWLLWTGLFAAVARPALGRLGAAAVAALLLVVEPIGLHAAASESPAALLGVLVCLGVLAARWSLAPDATRPERALGLALALLLATAVALVRVELLPVAGAALVALGARLGARRGGRLAALLDPPRGSRQRRWGPLVLLGALAVALGSLWWVEVSAEGPLAWALRAWKPGATTWVVAPALLAGTVPPGTLLLLGLGVVRGFRRPLATGALGLTVPFVYLLYVSQWGWGFFVHYRYLVQLWPLLSLLALAGVIVLAGALRRFAARGPRPRLAAAGLALLAVAATAGPHLAGVAVMGVVTRPPTPFTLLDTNKQRAARFLVDVFRRHPDALLLTRASLPPHWKEDRGRFCAPLVYEPGAANALLGRTAPPEAIPAALAAAPPGAVLCYRGLDANLRIRSGCEVSPAPGAEVLAEARWLSRPQVPYGYQGAEEPLVHLAVFRCDPTPLLAPPARDDAPPGLLPRAPWTVQP
jgi:hypothetical protein